MRLVKNYVTIGCLCLLLWAISGTSAKAAPRLQDTGEELVIVIDPGHGGVNEGTIAGEYPEKQMTLVSARAMYEELQKFDDVKVFLTRTDDSDISLADRAEFAKSVNADFMFSIHYNASEYHTMFGTEVWVSCETPYNAYGYQYGYLQMLEMQDMGLYLRGIKTKLNEKGTDYYGVLREAAARQIPSVIIEHCHVDEARDILFCETEEDWALLGRADARAAAKYFGLSSSQLGIDYSEESNQLPDVNENMRVQSTMRDETSPDVCTIELLHADYQTGEVKIQVTATDYDSPLLYYDYSLDGGVTYCPLQPWPEVDVLEGTCTDIFTLPLQIASGVQPEIVLRAYNAADLFTESNALPFLQAFYYGMESDTAEGALEKADTTVERERHSAGTTTFIPAFADNEENGKEEVSILTFLQLCLVFVIVLLGAVIISQIITYRKRRKRRRQRRNDAGETRNHIR